jgi:hypothetical protein
MDATALCIVAEEVIQIQTEYLSCCDSRIIDVLMSSSCISLQFSASDPGFTLSTFGHSMLFAHNLSQNGSEAQKEKYLPDSVQGDDVL